MYFEPVVQNFRIKRGADFSFTFDLMIDDVVVDLSGATVSFQVREQMVRTSTKMFDGSVSVNAQNEITIGLTDTQTAWVTRTVGFYDVLVTTAAGVDYYPIEGQLTFSGSATVKA